jgi:hypothetical protein
MHIRESAMPLSEDSFAQRREEFKSRYQQSAGYGRQPGVMFPYDANGHSRGISYLNTNTGPSLTGATSLTSPLRYDFSEESAAKSSSSSKAARGGLEAIRALRKTRSKNKSRIDISKILARCYYSKQYANSPFIVSKAPPTLPGKLSGNVSDMSNAEH